MQSLPIAIKIKSKFFSHLPCYFCFPTYTIWGTMPIPKWQYFCQPKSQSLSLPHFPPPCPVLHDVLSQQGMSVIQVSSQFRCHPLREVLPDPQLSSCLTITFPCFVCFTELNECIIYFMYLFTCLLPTSASLHLKRYVSHRQCFRNCF